VRRRRRVGVTGAPAGLPAFDFGVRGSGFPLGGKCSGSLFACGIVEDL
jgi:hypothetical protein